MFRIRLRHSLLKSGILTGKTDVHCHVLPGVDDGSPDVEHSLELLQFMEQTMGFRRVWLTPHVMQDLGNTADRLAHTFASFKKHYRGPILLQLASEYMLDAGFAERLSTDPLPLGEKRLLVETSYMSAPPDLYDILLAVWHKGYRPLIAHPERYMYMELDDYELLKSKGYEFQLNLMSLSGYYGPRPKLVAEDLLERGMYDMVGSDLHHLRRYADMFRHLRLTRQQLDALEQLYANNEQV